MNLRKHLQLLSLLSISQVGWAATSSSTLTRMEEVVRHALVRSPELRAARIELQQSELVEPLFLSDLDTQLEAGYSKTDDQSPRAAPSFEGSRDQRERFNVDLVQKTLIGTEARLSWINERVANDAAFRVLDPSADSMVSLGVKQNLLRYFWGRPDVARRESYRADVIAASERVRQQATELTAAVVRVVLEVEFARERIAIAERAVATAAKLVQSYDEKKRFGLVELSDEIQAATSLQAEETELLLARSALVNANHALREYMGPDVTVAVSTSTLPFLEWTLEMPSSEEAVDQARQHRGDLKALEALAKAAEWATRSEVLETLPQLSLDASYGFAGLNGTYRGAWDDLGGYDHPVRSIGINFISPLAYRKEKLTRKNKQLAWDLTREQLDRQTERVEREVKDALETLRLSKDRSVARERLVSLQRKKYAAERENFRRGRSNTDLLVRFLQDIHQNEVTYLLARLQTQQAQVELARSTGTLLAKFGLEKLP